MHSPHTIGVVGVWHLGQTYCAGLAELGHAVIGYDENRETVEKLKSAQPVIAEPGIEELLKKHIEAKQLSFRDDAESLKNCDVIWVTYDTPISENDIPDTSPIFRALGKVVPVLKDGVLLVISSQLPVGTTQKIKTFIDGKRRSLVYDIAYVPENLFLGRALESFFKPTHIVIGAENPAVFQKIESLFEGINTSFLRMGVASAEMSKHALNAFGAASLSFIHDIADICEATGADVMDVIKVLKSDPRVGPNAYISPGVGFSGGTLARDLNALLASGREYGIALPVIGAVLDKNARRRQWISQKLHKILGNLKGKTIGVFGLTYKPGTPTLRRSLALEIIKDLKREGALVRAHDPMADKEEVEKNGVPFFRNAYEAAKGCHAALFITDWPEFLSLDFGKIRPLMAEPAALFDAKNAFYKKAEELKKLGFLYLGVGRAGSPGAATSGSPPRRLPGDRDKVAVITGGARGIGYKIAEHFLKNEWFLVLVSRTKGELERAQSDLEGISDKIIVFPADVSRPEDIKQLEKFIGSELGGRVDALINAAGILGPIGPLDSLDEDGFAEWIKAFAVNTFGSALMSRAVIPFMKQRGGGRIINFSGGGDGSLPNFTAYVASKGALLRFTESLAAELKGAKIWVNIIAPGPVNTALMDQVIAAGPEKAGKEFYEQSLKWKKEGATPPEKAAALVLFLASPEAEGITGKFFSAVWDNFDTIASHKDEIMKSDIYTVRRIKPEDRGFQWS